MEEKITFIKMCQEGKAQPRDWKAWLEVNPDKQTQKKDLLGLLKEEYEDLEKGTHSMDFFLLKRKMQKPIKNVWAGCYVKFAFEIDAHDPHFEFGWVDIVNNEQGFCKVQCDDNFFGTRALTLRIMDVLEIYPFKERPLIYYKTMICNECNECDRIANDLPPDECPYNEFFNAILNKQIADLQFINLYKQVEEQQIKLQQEIKEKQNNSCGCGGCEEDDSASSSEENCNSESCK